MPGLNGTGPHGNGAMSGRRFGRCPVAPVPAQVPFATTQPAYDENGSTITQGSDQDIPVHDRGWGRISCGCGRGIRFGGCRRNPG
mgnify:CR=1 FL=1